ncbi:MAG: hypothetical protein OSJ56_14275, partial [Prevotella sp.]|nr:hypothetical protein [Prevotella sp.]
NKKSWGNYTFDGGKWTLQKQAFLSLAHEMFHTESFLSGYTPKIWGYMGGEPYFTDEIWAITGENYIMHEHGLHEGEYGLGYRIGYGIIGPVSDDFPYGTKEPMYFEYEQCKEYFDNNTDVVRRINTNASMRKFQRQYGIKQN